MYLSLFFDTLHYAHSLCKEMQNNHEPEIIVHFTPSFKDLHYIIRLLHVKSTLFLIFVTLWNYQNGATLLHILTHHLRGNWLYKGKLYLYLTCIHDTFNIIYVKKVCSWVMLWNDRFIPAWIFLPFWRITWLNQSEL